MRGLAGRVPWPGLSRLDFRRRRRSSASKQRIRYQFEFRQLTIEDGGEEIQAAAVTKDDDLLIRSAEINETDRGSPLDLVVSGADLKFNVAVVDRQFVARDTSGQTCRFSVEFHTQEFSQRQRQQRFVGASINQSVPAGFCFWTRQCEW